MRSLVFVLALIVFVSCGRSDKNFDGSSKNYTDLKTDTNCISFWSNGFFEFKTKDHEAITTAIKEKVIAVLGDKVFNEKQVLIMRDSLNKAFFSPDRGLVSGNHQIDTTNMLRMEDELDYYLGDKITPRTFNIKHVLTQDDFFTYQKSSDFSIGYELHPCMKKILEFEGEFKRVRKGMSLPDHALNNNPFKNYRLSHPETIPEYAIEFLVKSRHEYHDRVYIYRCLFDLTIIIDIDEFSGIFKNRKGRQFYEVRLSDTASVFTTVDLYKEYPDLLATMK